ncbi:mercury(II) reductase [Candidatus Woesearchaeota archaeon]|nr:mercury(II) reductase [Candidatus Woesearchaeota archaeon]
MTKYDLIILGGGAAAFAAANRANLLGKKTLMINDSKILPLGGTCVNVGCVPSKIMLHQGSEYYYPAHSSFKAVKVKGTADFVEALKETKQMIEGFRKKNYGNVIKKQEHVGYKEGKASFVDEHTVSVGDSEYSADYILIATGASTSVPPIEGIEKIAYLTNKNVFELKKKPKSVIILGAGPQGMEFSQIFHHFGIKTTVLQRSDRVLPKFDPDISAEVQRHLQAEGIQILTGVEAKEVKKTKTGLQLTAVVKGKKRTFSAAALFLGTGLQPHTKKLEAQNAGVKLDKRGFVKVNRHFRTSRQHIFAAGDVTGMMPLETTAAKEGNLAVLNMFENAKKSINYRQVPYAVFTSPEAAAVGITEAEYMQRYKTCMCSTIKLDHVEKALAIKDARGIIKMVLEHRTRRVLGVQIAGPQAADIITLATYAIRNKMTIDDIKDTVHVFPTLSEMIKKVAQSFTQNLNEMACCVE